MNSEIDALSALEERLAAYHMGGQWQGDPDRAQASVGDAERVVTEPIPSGVPHLWEWSKVTPLLDEAAEALTESHTARRSLVLKNPGLRRSTTQTLIAGLQIIRPGEVAWTHRHTITALRFVIRGGPRVFTVVEGEPLMMEPYDLILTPNWTWHDHHNEGDTPAVWLDSLDVPLLHGLNQIFYEELGQTTQNRREAARNPSSLLRPAWAAANALERPLRYSWAEAKAQLDATANATPSPHDGIALEYVNPATGGSALLTIGCWIQMLPPGFEGERHRHTSSAIYFVVGGEGRTEFGETTLHWQKHDAMALPNWTWHRHVNASKTEPAYLFSVNDIPMLRGFGLYREEPSSTLATVAPMAQAG